MTGRDAGVLLGTRRLRLHEPCRRRMLLPAGSKTVLLAPGVPDDPRQVHKTATSDCPTLLATRKNACVEPCAPTRLRFKQAAGLKDYLILSRTQRCLQVYPSNILKTRPPSLL